MDESRMSTRKETMMPDRCGERTLDGGMAQTGAEKRSSLTPGECRGQTPARTGIA